MTRAAQIAGIVKEGNYIVNSLDKGAAKVKAEEAAQAEEGKT